MNKLFICTTLLLSLSVHAKVVSTPNSAVIIKADGNLIRRVCYYQDRVYSIGAILQVGEHYMVCKQENDFETNGALSWYPLKATTKTTK